MSRDVQHKVWGCFIFCLTGGMYSAILSQKFLLLNFKFFVLKF